jgi:uncharacterized membrane protein
MLEMVDLVARWFHVLAAMAAVGGTLFMRWALLPAAAQLAPEARDSLLQAVRSRWARVVMAAIALLLVSGLYNISRKEVMYHVTPLYHALFGIKFLLAMGIFFLASALVGRSEAYAAIRRRASTWLAVNLLMAVLVVCISGVLRSQELKSKRPAPERTSRAAQHGAPMACGAPAPPRTHLPPGLHAPMRHA